MIDYLAHHAKSYGEGQGSTEGMPPYRWRYSQTGTLYTSGLPHLLANDTIILMHDFNHTVPKQTQIFLDFV